MCRFVLRVFIISAQSKSISTAVLISDRIDETCAQYNGIYGCKCSSCQSSLKKGEERRGDITKLNRGHVIRENECQKMEIERNDGNHSNNININHLLDGHSNTRQLSACGTFILLAASSDANVGSECEFGPACSTTYMCHAYLALFSCMVCTSVLQSIPLPTISNLTRTTCSSTVRSLLAHRITQRQPGRHN
jgi:hypothetical protein